eukprot:6214571-Pleurochrysis_carterae.AAC.2
MPTKTVSASLRAARISMLFSQPPRVILSVHLHGFMPLCRVCDVVRRHKAHFDKCPGSMKCGLTMNITVCPVLSTSFEAMSINSGMPCLLQSVGFYIY